MKLDGFVKSPAFPLGAGLRAGSRETRESFFLCHPDFDFLRVHQT
ncbi:MAG: hypothetical protein NTY64_00145 [Deltaproteobacteria bacterium]|nr:hypothetical protein [Deltaproteobacteria bacterium]